MNQLLEKYLSQRCVCVGAMCTCVVVPSIVRLDGKCAAESNSLIEHDKCPECGLVNVCVCL